MALTYKVDNETVGTSTVVTYTIPTPSVSGKPHLNNGVSMLDIQAIDGDLYLYDAVAGTGDYRTIKENSSISMNLRHLEGTELYFKASATDTRAEFLYIEGLGT